MFTDDKMEQVYAETGKAIDALKVLLDTLDDPDGVGGARIKQANNIWKLFASRHKDRIKPDGFKNIMLKYFPEKADALNKLLSLGFRGGNALLYRFREFDRSLFPKT